MGISRERFAIHRGIDYYMLQVGYNIEIITIKLRGQLSLPVFVKSMPKVDHNSCFLLIKNNLKIVSKSRVFTCAT